MTDDLIRGLSPEAVAQLDEEAAKADLSRNEYLVRILEGAAQRDRPAAITAQDWADSAEAFADLSDPAVMKGAWD